MSFITLIWGICRMLRIVGSQNGIMPNKITIIMQIVAYFFIVLANVTSLIPIAHGTPKVYLISSVCNLVVYCICNLLLSLIIY